MLSTKDISNIRYIKQINIYKRRGDLVVKQRVASQIVEIIYNSKKQSNFSSKPKISLEIGEICGFIICSIC